MKRSAQFVRIYICLAAAILSYSSATCDDAVSISVTESVGCDLVDGVYPVVTDDTTMSPSKIASETVELNVLALGEDRLNLPKLRIMKQSLLQFNRSVYFGFKFEDNECTQVEFDNTEKLKAYSRKHAPTRLAVVVGNQIVTHHKLRGPIESEKVRITCCTEGGGDHLRKHLLRIQYSSVQNAESMIDE